MHILELVRSVDPKGGGVIAGVAAIAQARLTWGTKTTVASLDHPAAFSPEQFPFQWIGLGPGKGRYGYSPAYLPWLMERVGDYDGVVINGLWDYHVLAGGKALRAKKKPYAIYPHGMLDPWFKHQYPLKHLKKWAYWPWGVYPYIRDAAAVCFTCDQERVLARESFWLYKAEEVVTGYGISAPPPATDRQVEAFLDLVPAAVGKRVVLFLSRIHRKKGCDLLLQAFARVMKPAAEWHLVMAGPDDDASAASLCQLAVELGIADRISWPGMLMGDAKWGAFRAADVFCLPSHSENFGIVVAEALACQCPVLISDKVNIWREIAEGQAGCVAPDSLAGTVQLLEEWVKATPAEIAGFRLRTQTVFEKHFAVMAAARNLEQVLLKVCGTAEKVSGGQRSIAK